jgi:hypothetical protein
MYIRVTWSLKRSWCAGVSDQELGKILILKREKVTEGSINFHNLDPYNLYLSNYIYQINENEMRHSKDRRNVHNISVE